MVLFEERTCTSRSTYCGVSSPGRRLSVFLHITTTPHCGVVVTVVWLWSGTALMCLPSVYPMPQTLPVHIYIPQVIKDWGC